MEANISVDGYYTLVESVISNITIIFTIVICGQNHHFHYNKGRYIKQKYNNKE